MCFFGCAPQTFGGIFSSVNSTTTRTGWTAGAGFEYGLTNNWSVKAEYLHVDLGSFSTTMPSCGGCIALGLAPTAMMVNHKYTDDIARVGVNFRFGS
jgi:outer membrane immunogenic protein